MKHVIVQRATWRFQKRRTTLICTKRFTDRPQKETPTCIKNVPHFAF